MDVLLVGRFHLWDGACRINARVADLPQKFKVGYVIAETDTISLKAA